LFHARKPGHDLLESALIFFIERIELVGIYVEDSEQITP
jgi:hypothetical protein